MSKIRSISLYFQRYLREIMKISFQIHFWTHIFFPSYFIGARFVVDWEKELLPIFQILIIGYFFFFFFFWKKGCVWGLKKDGDESQSSNSNCSFSQSVSRFIPIKIERSSLRQLTRRVLLADKRAGRLGLNNSRSVAWTPTSHEISWTL